MDSSGGTLNAFGDEDFEEELYDDDEEMEAELANQHHHHIIDDIEDDSNCDNDAENDDDSIGLSQHEPMEQQPITPAPNTPSATNSSAPLNINNATSAFHSQVESLTSAAAALRRQFTASHQQHQHS